MKSAISFLASMAVSLSVSCMAQGSSDWETLPIAPADDEISEWWIRTWNPGDVVQMSSGYSFEGRLRIRKRDLKDVRWYEFAKRYGEAEQAVRIEGLARCTTAVLDAPGPEDGETDRETQLVRTFHSCPISTRAAAVVGVAGGVEKEKAIRKGLDHFYEELRSPEAQEAIDVGVECLSTIARLAVTAKVAALGMAAIAAQDVATVGAATPANPTEAAAVLAAANAAGKVTELAVKWAGRKGKEHINDKTDLLKARNLEMLKGARFESYGDSDIRGTEMKADSWFFKSLSESEAHDLANIATTLNDLFDNAKFYIAGSRGESIFAKRLVDIDGDEGESYRTFASGITNLPALPPQMRAVPLTPEDYRASKIFARETLDVNAALFDVRRRVAGDVWRADASLLNNFLHPDLEGRFEGTVFLQYVRDEPISLVRFPEATDRIYQTRLLKMLPRYMGKPSRLSYRESGFHLDYDPDDHEAGLSVWVDKASGHVVKVEAEVNGTAAALPKLALFRGFSLYDSNGALHFTMTAESCPTRMLPEIPE